MDAFPELEPADHPAPLRRRIGPWIALSASLLVHAGLLVWMAVWLLPEVPLPLTNLVLARWENATDPGDEPVRVLSPASAADARQALPLEAAPHEALSTAGSSGFDALAIGTLEPAVIEPKASRGQSAGDAQGNGTGKTPGDGDGGSGGGGEPVTFFDVPLPANFEKVVFVVDASGSMHGKRFDRARRELIYTLKQLGSSRQFYVVFFNAYDFPQFHPMRTREFVPATPENIEKIAKWAAEFRPSGDTHPMSSIRKALELRPDAIFLLSDGAFERRTIDLIRQFNKQKITINTIGLEDQAGEALLEEIARLNRGKYLFVP